MELESDYFCPKCGSKEYLILNCGLVWCSKCKRYAIHEETYCEWEDDGYAD